MIFIYTTSALRQLSSDNFLIVARFAVNNLRSLWRVAGLPQTSPAKRDGSGLHKFPMLTPLPHCSIVRSTLSLLVLGYNLFETHWGRGRCRESGR